MNVLSKHLIVCFFVLSGITACVCAAPKSTGDVAQIIVKFKDHSTVPATPALLESLSESAKLSVRHVRPMSGGAQIYLLSGTASEAALSEAMARITARPDVEYAEIDRKLKPEKEQPNGSPQK